jgi:hypothetical protein
MAIPADEGTLEPGGAPPRPRRARRAWWWLVVVVAVVVVAGVAVIVRESTRKVPSFPLLTEHPDPSLHGTVAYYAQDGCVHIVAASGAADKSVLCLPQGQDVKQAEKLGKLIGPQLVWLSDGRLEVTMFRMTGPPGPGETWHKGWQKRVDVATGAVEEVPFAQVPNRSNLGTRPTVSPSDERITFSSRQGGEVKIVLTTKTGTARTLMSAHGPENAYGLNAVFWAPNWKWVAADDRRILVVTTGVPATTRVLVEPNDSGFGGSADDATFAITADDLVPGATTTTSAPSK